MSTSQRWIMAFLFFGSEVVSDIGRFKSERQAIVTNRCNKVINDVEDQIYTRDIFNKD